MEKLIGGHRVEAMYEDNHSHIEYRGTVEKVQDNLVYLTSVYGPDLKREKDMVINTSFLFFKGFRILD